MLHTVYSRWLAWQSTRQVEVCLALFNICWALQVYWYGSGYQHVIPITISSLVLVAASVLQLYGLLRHGYILRRVALFIELVTWGSLALSILLVKHEVAFIYSAFAFASVWAYLVLSQNKATAGRGASGTWNQH